MRNIVVVEYAPVWPEQFAVESRHLSDALTSTLIGIHHIGSTSVPGLAAKPTIDILAVVRSLDELDACNNAMIDLGYEPKGEFGIVRRRFFAKGSDACRTHHVHAYEPGHLEIEAHLAFRNYLRVHPEQVLQYAALKARLAERHRNDIEAYVEGKASFVREILENARQRRDALYDTTPSVKRSLVTGSNRLDVRSLQPGEWRLWRDLRLRALTDSPDAFGETLSHAKRCSEEDWVNRAASATLLVAEHDGHPVGMAVVRISETDRSRANLYAMWVDPATRRMGVGRALVDEAIKCAQSAGVSEVELRVTNNNGPARKLYRMAGFVETGTEKLIRPDLELQTEIMLLQISS